MFLATNKKDILSVLFKVTVHPKINIVIVYLPSCCSNLLEVWNMREMLGRMLKTDSLSHHFTFIVYFFHKIKMNGN